ncbi:DUF4450 domain-containing protein [Labilibaculum manganireducens]|uniref:DUF4450 domain-containing protein n=1 Tax=Labilibaculum manganireducens TaxID=1940525 RepID=UPI0029F49DA5|nr:DUF4450 domain-containing protein [Labilibaculum manganireducens]
MRLFLTAILSLSFICATAQYKSDANNKLERELRYQPDNDGFVILNGNKKFNRALYGGHSAFRVETGDVPEFGFFMPNMGGNLQLGFVNGQNSVWLNSASQIKSTYYPGCRIYEIQDSFISNGIIKLAVLALADSDGMIMKIETENIPEGIELLLMYGGASNKRFSRNGDLGVDKPDCFDLHADDCLGNDYSIYKNCFSLDYGQNTKNPRSIEACFPADSKLKTGSPFSLDSPMQVWNSKVSDNKSVLVAKIPLENSVKKFVCIQLKSDKSLNYSDLTEWYDQAEARRKEIANAVQIETPDSFINPLGGVLSTAADAIWDNCWMHGAIGWRMPLNGWRAAYVGDCVGWHHKARQHFDNYAASQITDIEPSIPHPAQDSSLNLARAEKKWGTPMYSNGYICRNPNQTTKMHHYDMNLCYIDELLWHLNWTGDWEYAKKVWPVIKRHLKWEKLNFDPDNDGLYDAYASIWASDALYYNSGAVTHSSAYNYRANKMAALIASKIGDDPQAYIVESEKIMKALNSKLWLTEKGWWAEYVDLMGNKNVHPDAGVWTIYHALDSDVSDIFQAYQATRYIDTEIPHIPVKARGLNDGINYETISTTHWFPYSWSINNVAFAEVAHTALSYWQAGRYDEGFKLFKSSVLDGMYLGSSPGNIGQISYYDKARGECYRDFGDPVGMYSRVLVEGLFGIHPDLLNNRLELRPGFPSGWEHASIATADITLKFDREEETDTYLIRNKLAEKVNLELKVLAVRDQISEVLVNGESKSWLLVENIGSPLIQINAEIKDSAQVQIIWKGKNLKKSDYQKIGVADDQWKFSTTNKIAAIYDPQNVLNQASVKSKSISGQLVGEVGNRTLFVQLEQGQMKWWEPVNIEIKDAFDISYNAEDEELAFSITNNGNKLFSGNVMVNQFSISLSVEAGQTSALIGIPDTCAVFGSNRLQILNDDKCLFQKTITNWNVKANSGNYKMVNMDQFFNASVSDIFKQEYLSPRSPYTTLQIPTQGIGEWCHPTHTAEIDDSGLRASAKNSLLNTPFHVPFRTICDLERKNIVFTSLWDNYPTKVDIPVSGKARHAYFMMAGSTNHMQCHIPNGLIKVHYTDGTREELNLVNPDNWFPIEQDLYVDDHAFALKRPAPYRIAFKTGIVSRNLGEELGISKDEVYGRGIDGGAGIFIDLPLNSSKELQSISLESLANDVVIGLMGITLLK